MENQQYIQEDEIDLRGYVNIVIKRKKLILVIFLVSIAAAVVASLLMPKVYEMTTVVRLGSVDIIQPGSSTGRSDQFLMTKEKAREIILNENFLLSIIKELNLKIKVENFRNDIKVILIEETNLIKIKVVYPGLDMLVKVNNAIVGSFITNGQSICQSKQNLVNKWLKQSDLDIKNVEADIDKIKSSISKLSDSGNDSAPKGSLAEVFSKVIQLQNILSGYESNLIKLREQRNNLELMFSAFKDFEIFDPPIMPKKPIMPLELNVLVAGIISLIFGVFLAVFIESWQKTKE